MSESGCWWPAGHAAPNRAVAAGPGVGQTGVLIPTTARSHATLRPAPQLKNGAQSRLPRGAVRMKQEGPAARDPGCATGLAPPYYHSVAIVFRKSLSLISWVICGVPGEERRGGEKEGGRASKRAPYPDLSSKLDKNAEKVGRLEGSLPSCKVCRPVARALSLQRGQRVWGP